MGERKVLNKYIPADFDPRLVPKSKKPKDEQVSVRMMLPFTMQCDSCSTFLYRGRKFNSKKEPVKGPKAKYLGIQRYRLMIKCSHCSRPITFLTDPENTDYEMESGATRNYEVWKDKEKTEAEIVKNREDEDASDAMKALENRVLDSQREMAELDQLDEIKAMNLRAMRLARGDVSDVLLKGKDGLEIEEEELNEHGLTNSEELLVKSIKFGKANSNSIGERKGNKRLNEQDEQEEMKMREEREKMMAQQQEKLMSRDVGDSNKKVGPAIIIRAKKKVKKNVDEPPTHQNATQSSKQGSLGDLLGGYTSSSSSE